MPIEGVQNYSVTTSKDVLTNALVGTVIGATGGYVAKHLIPLNKTERKDVPTKAIINVARKETNKKMVDNFKKLNNRSLAQDTFIKMIENKNFNKYAEITQDLAKTNTEVAEEFKRIKQVANRDSNAHAKKYASGYHKFIKCKRSNSKFVGIGAAVGVLGGVLYNIFHNKNVQ